MYDQSYMQWWLPCNHVLCQGQAMTFDLNLMKARALFKYLVDKICWVGILYTFVTQNFKNQ